MNPESVTVIGYIRASTPQQRSTILTQYELIQRHCQTYGFTCQPHPTVTGAKVLVRCPLEGPILDRILTGDLSTLSANETARRLNAGGIATKKGGPWYGATVGSVRKTSGTEVAA